MLPRCTDRVATLRIAVCGLDQLSAPQSYYYLFQTIKIFFYVCRWYKTLANAGRKPMVVIRPMIPGQRERACFVPFARRIKGGPDGDTIL